MNKVLQRKTGKRLLLIFMVFAICLSAVLNALSFSSSAKKVYAEDFVTTAVSITNSNFEGSSGSFPAAPTGWTKVLAPGQSEGSVASGVLNIESFRSDKDVKQDSHLQEYAEYSGNGFPLTPFGPDSPLLPGSNKNVLMINVYGQARSTISYKSSDITLNANSYYKISAWVKTQNKGVASIRINGLSDNVAVNGINTMKDVTDINTDKLSGHLVYGWRKYTFYIATSPLSSSTVSVSLGIGDYYKDTTDPDNSDVVAIASNGYAFFDNIEAYQLSANTFNHETENPADEYNIYKFIEQPSAFVSDAQKESFTNSTLIKNTWERGAESGDASNANWVTYRSDASDVKEGNSLGLENNPVSSTGAKNPKNTNLEEILLVSTYNNKSFLPAASYLESPQLDVNMFEFYRLSVWVKTESITGGSGATLVVKTNIIDNDATAADKDKETQYLKFTAANCTGDDSNTSRNGWKEYSFFIKGSIIRDYKFSLQLFLGQKDNQCGGIAMFHNIKFDKLTYAQYNDNNSSGTVVDIDGEFQENSTGVLNGGFFTPDAYTKLEFPLAPSSWQYIDAATAGTTGFSSSVNFVNYDKNDNIVKGIIPTNVNHFAAQEYKNNITNPSPYDPLDVNTLSAYKNVLALSSPNNTAIGYRSPQITVTAETVKKISVTMLTQSIEGYGANLVLKNGNSVIGSIEKILETRSNSGKDFQTFSFYVEAGKSEAAVIVEIWLGLIDRDDNSSKLAKGNIYIAKVSAEDVTESFESIVSAYKARVSLNNGATINNVPYSFNATAFDAYDYYDTSFLKTPYNWTYSGNHDTSTVSYGIFDASNSSSNVIVPAGFYNNKQEISNVLMLYNSAPNASALTLNSGFKLTANMYYKLTVSMKVDIPHYTDGQIGASINIVGTDYGFKDVKSTATITDSIIDNETFRDFTFYIANGAEDREIQIQIALGGSEYSNEKIAGRVYVSKIEFTEDISNVLYEEMEEKVKDADDKLTVGADFVKIVDLGIVTDDNEGEKAPSNSGFNWWLIPSILFSLALVIALIGVVARRLVDNNSKKRIRYEKVSEYDRNQTLNKIHNENAAKESGDKVMTVMDDTQYEEFDEKISSNAVKEKSRPVLETAETESDTIDIALKENAATKDKEEDNEIIENDYLDQFDD